MLNRGDLPGRIGHRCVQPIHIIITVSSAVRLFDLIAEPNGIVGKRCAEPVWCDDGRDSVVRVVTERGSTQFRGDHRRQITAAINRECGDAACDILNSPDLPDTVVRETRSAARGIGDPAQRGTRRNGQVPDFAAGVRNFVETAIGVIVEFRLICRRFRPCGVGILFEHIGAVRRGHVDARVSILAAMKVDRAVTLVHVGCGGIEP